MRALGRRLAAPLGAALLAAPAAPAARAQDADATIALADAPIAARTRPADSARVLKRARGAQATFERVRRAKLPWMWDQGSGRCDEVVGRWCYNDDDVDRAVDPPPEPPELARDRERLIAVLDTAAGAIPGDEWVAGQRVRYLVEAGRPADAVAAASDCAAARWWCRALAGYAHHEAGEFEAAEAAFAEALEASPARERDEWRDLAPLLGGDDAKAWRRLAGAARDAAAARFWWLADPLWSLPGNDRLTEHYARHVFDRLQERARTTEGSGWDDGLRALLLRYGPPHAWRRVHPRTLTPLAEPRIVTYFEQHGRDFLPPFHRLGDLASARPDEWTLSPRFARTRYAPAYAVVADSLPFQVARFRAGDSMVVVAAYEMPDDSVFLPRPRERGGRDGDDARSGGDAGGSARAGATDGAAADSTVEAALVVVEAPGAEPTIARLTTSEREAALRVTVAPRGGVASIEALSRGSRRAARARVALAGAPDPSAGAALSDLLLVSSEEPLPTTLDEAAPRARPRAAAGAGERIALYWETYGLDVAGEPLAVRVAIVPPRAGWLRRGIEQLGVATPASGAELQWEVPAPEVEAMQHHSVAITLPDLPPGRYTMRVTVAQPGRGEAVRERELTITRE